MYGLSNYTSFEFAIILVSNLGQEVEIWLAYLTYVGVHSIKVFLNIASYPEKVRYKVIGGEMKGMESSMKLVALGATQRKG